MHKLTEVVSQKEKHCVSSVTSGEKGITTTVLCAMNVIGQYIPPMMVFKRKIMKLELIDHAPVGTIGGCSDNGWITADLFFQYIQHFAKYTNSSKENKVLLILDGYKVHTRSTNVIDFAGDNGIVIVSLPPHTSLKLQPLDRSLFKPLKSAYNPTCSRWMRDHPGRRITTDQLGGLF